MSCGHASSVGQAACPVCDGGRNPPSGETGMTAPIKAFAEAARACPCGWRTRDPGPEHNSACPNYLARREDGVGGQAGPGRKFDQGKDPWSLFYFPFAQQVVRVLEFGARKYEPNNWQKVPDFRNRYFSSMMRHLVSWWEGESHDPESGLNHLAHAGCCLMFLMWNEAKAGLLERRKAA